MIDRDPMEVLDAFYAGIRNAEIPPVKPISQELRFAIPAIGAALGIAAAVAIALYPSEPSREATERTVQALAAHQLAAPQPPNQSLNQVERKPWTA
jgi:hypothetical protein